VHVKLKMSENSLFAILLRSPWWISIAIAAFIGMLAAVSLQRQYMIYGVFTGAPFLIVGLIAAWKQLRMPGAARVADTLGAVSSMSWRDFSNRIEEAFRQDGYQVDRLPGPQADFSMSKSGRTTLVSCRRWKAARNGIEPLRELYAAMQAREAQSGIYVTTGDISDTARKFANEKKIVLLGGAELAQLLLRVRAAKTASR
jgi:restriction system protein